MEVTSTLRSQRFESTGSRGFSTAHRRFAGSPVQLIFWAGRLIKYCLKLLREDYFTLLLNWFLHPIPALPVGYRNWSSLDIHPADRVGIRLAGEPPDIPGSAPPGHSALSIQQTINSLVQHPMNEHLLPTKSLRNTAYRAVSDAGGGPAAGRLRGSSPGSSSCELRSPFVSRAQNTGIAALKSVCSIVAFLLLLLTGGATQAQTTADLSVTQTINDQNPAIGSVVTYTIVVTNTPTSTTATNVVLRNSLPAGGAAYVPGSAAVLSGNGTFNPATGELNISSIEPGASVALVLSATVLERGVWFNTAEIIAATPGDPDSVPGNGVLLEDDYDAICFSVPILFYAGDEFVVSIPSQFDQIVWYRRETPASSEVPISTSTVSTSLAEVNADFTLSIRSPGTYSFQIFRQGCPASNCCNIQVDPGPLGSLGNFVFTDANRNGVQDPGEVGLDGVTVELYASTGATSTTLISSTVTSGGGQYLFPNLQSGNYIVRFVTPPTYQPSPANVPGVPDELDSDAGPDGFTGVYTIDTGQPEGSTARNNLTVDAGFYLTPASIGDKVFVDTNRDGRQATDGSEPGLDGVTVTLVSNGVSLSTVTTANGGIYSFTGLTPGVPYSVSFTTPVGYTATLANQGDDAGNSDPVGGITAPITLTVGENNTNVDAGFYLIPGVIGGQTFVDNDQDGVLDGDEPALDGVTVTLVSNGTVVVTATTTNGGVYSFTGLTPGVPYSVSFTTPVGFTSTLAGNVSGPITLTAGQSSLSVNAGFVPQPGVIGGQTFVDNDQDGVLDGNETGLPGVVVTLVGSNGSSLTTVSGIGGTYSFTAVTPGVSYSVVFTNPAGFTSTLAGNTAGPIVLSPGQSSLSVNAGFVPVAPAPSLVVSVGTPVCDPTTNVYTATGTLQLTNAPAGTLTVTDNGAIAAVVSVSAGQTTASFNLTGLSGSSPDSRSVVASLALSATATLSASTTYAVPASCTVATPVLVVNLGEPVCNPATNVYTAIGIVQLANTPAGSLTITDNGVVAAVVSVSVGQTTANFSLTGLSGSLPPSHTVVASLGLSATATLSTSTTYTTPASCTVAAPVLTVSVEAPICDPATNIYTAVGLVQLANTPAGSLTIIDNGVVAVVVSVSAGQTTASFNLTGLSGSSPDSRSVVASLALSATATLSASTTYAVPASCTVAPASLLVSVGTPVCNPATNIYTAVGAVQLANTPAGSLTITDNGVVAAVVSVSAGQATADFSLTGLSGSSPASRSVVASLGLSATATLSASATYAVPASCTVAPASLLVSVETPICNPVTNIYTVTGSVQLANTPAGSLTITDNGVVAAVVPVNAGQVSATFTLTGLSGSSSDSRSVVASLGLSATATISASTSYAVPASCTVATPVLVVSVDTPVCDPATNVYSTSALVQLANTPAGSLTITDNGVVAAVVSVSAGQASATVNLTGLSGSLPPSHTVVASLGLSATATLSASTTYTTPASCTMAPMLMVMVIDPTVCNPATNIYSTTGVVQLTNAQPSSLTLTDNGVVAAVISVSAGQASVPFNLTGVSGTPPFTHTVVATVALSATTVTASTTYAVPTSCTVAPASLVVSVGAPVCNPVTNLYAAVGLIQLANTPAGSLTITDNGVVAAVVSVSAGQATATFTLTGLSGSSPASRSVVASLALSTTATLSASTTYAVPASCTVATPVLAVNVGAPVCNPATNIYTAVGLVQLANTPAGSLTITDNGVVAAVVSVSAGQATAAFDLTGLSGSSPASRSVVASLGLSATATLTASTTYAVPASCTVAPASLLVSVSAPVCNPATNIYTAAGVVQLANTPVGSLTITDNGVVAAVVSVSAGQASASFSLTGLSGSSPASRNVIASLGLSATATLSASTSYAVPASCTVATPVLVVSVGAPVCNSATNAYSTTGVVQLANTPAGSLTITDNGVVAAVVSVSVGQATANFSLTGLSGTLPANHTVTASLAVSGTAPISASTTYATPVSCTMAPMLMVMVIDPTVCNPATNIYSTTGVVQLTNAQPSSLTLTDNGVVAAVISVSAGQASVPFNLTGVSGTPPFTHTVVATVALSATTVTASTTYAVPASCTVATPVLVVNVDAPVCNPSNNVYTATGLVQLANTPAGSLTITDNGVVAAVVSVSAGQATADFSLTGLSGTAPASRSVVASLGLSATATLTASTTYAVPASCTVAPASLAVSINDPAVCNPATNLYSTTAVAQLINTPAGSLTITDNGVVAAVFSVSAGQTSLVFNLTGVSGTPPFTHTIVASLGTSTTTLTASTTYAVPASCTTCSVLAIAPVNVIGGQLGQAYSQTLTASGGTAPYTYIVLQGSLPAGISLNALTGVLSGTPTSATATSFTVLVTDSRSCSGTAPYSLSIGTTCPADFSLVVSADASICNGDSIRLTASAGIAGVTLNYYLTPIDGVPFATAPNGSTITVRPTTTTVYYVEAVTADGCRSVRRPIVVTVTTVPTPICLGLVRNVCPAITVNLANVQIENQTTGLVYEYYTSINRSPATRVTNLTAVGAGQYYLFARSGSCYSNPTVLTVEIVDCNCTNPPSVTANPGLAVCSGDVVPLVAQLSGSATSVVWSTSGTGSFSNPTSLTTTYVPSKADSAAGSVVLTVRTNAGPGAFCAAATYSLIVRINPRPAPPVGVACDDTLVCQGSSTKLIAFAPGFRINWYDQDNRLVGTTQSGGKLVVTPSRAGRIVYSAEAFGETGCVSTRSSVTVTVGTCLADLMVMKQMLTPAPYRVGQRVTYSITASNNGPITGTAVNVTDRLPATLTYVSSTPTGEYNPATGTWSIGTLTAGSNRSLLVEATINAGGSITNTAIIGGTNNDPRLARNDTSSVTISVDQCTAQPPVIVCAVTEVCLGGSTTLLAQGCAGGLVRWSDGQQGPTVSVRPQMTTTYSASCVVGSCVSSASNPITVTVLNPSTPIITASADRVCPGTSVTLTASGCTGGIIEWSDRTQTGLSIVVNPLSRTTYTAQCRVGSCLSQPAAKTIDISTDLPTPTIVCSTTSICPGETVTLTVANCVGTPVWNSTTATTGSIIVTPTPGNNTYSVYCTNGGCVSKTSPVYTIEIVTPTAPVITASADSVCARAAVVLSATGCQGDVLWSNGQTGPSITVNPTASISYYAQCRIRACLSAPSNAVNITVVTPAAPIIATNKTLICSGDKVTLTAEGCQGTVKWSGTDRLGASIEIMPTETREYFATCRIAGCESEASNRIRITVNTTQGPAPSITASTTSICSGGSVSLTATGCTSGTVLWSNGQTGPVITVNPSAATDYFAVCRSGAQCGSAQSNVIRIQVTPVPTPTVICSTDSICPGERVTLTVANCVGTPMWSTSQTTTSIIVSPTVTTSYQVYCQSAGCTSAPSILYTIRVIPVVAPTITASATAVAAGGTVTLTATGCQGEVIWSANDVNGNNRGPSIVVRPEGTQTYYAQCRFRECLSERSNLIVVNPTDCGVSAGTLAAVNATVCADTAAVTTIAATPNGGLVQPAGYSVLYVLTKGTELVVQQTSTTPRFSVPSVTGSYTIHTLVYNATPSDRNYLDLSVVQPNVTTAADLLKLIADRRVCAALDPVGAKVLVRIVAPPIVFAETPSLTVCAGTKLTLGASGCEGGIVNWSDGSIGARIEKTIVADLWVTATCTIDGCTSKMSTMIDVILGTPGIPTVGVDKPLVCAGETVTLTATGCQGGTYIWSDGTTTGNTLRINPTADVSYRVRCKVGLCEGAWSPFTTVKVGALTAPTVVVTGATGSNVTACFGAPITLTAQGCPSNAYVTWSNDQVGNSITVSLANGGTYTARCCISNACKSAPSNPITVTVLPKIVAPIAVDRTNACPFNTVDLATAVTSQVTTAGGVFEYYTSAALTSATKVANPAAVGSGTYYVVEKTTTGCYSLPAVIHVQIMTCTEIQPCNASIQPRASAGADASICAAKTYQLNGSMSGSAQVAHWTTSGSGTFDNPFAPNAIYTASAEDVLSGRVTLTMSVSTNNASCPAANSDAMILTINGSKSVPTVNVIGATAFCYGDSVILRAPAGATYLWSNRATTQQIVVKNSGTYSVQLMDASGCSSVASAPVSVSVSDPGTPLLVRNIRNACPSTVANLYTAVSNPTPGASYEFFTSPTSHMAIVRADSVGAGTYYVCEKKTSGCLSLPAKVEVNIFNCVADSLTTDVSITKMVSASVVKRGQPVTYTLMVRNQGTHTAHNIDVRDVLPAGLELVATPTANYTVSGGMLTKRIDSLMAGRADSIVFAARMLAKGPIVNQAEITYLDEVDTNPANNVSNVTVRDTSALTPSLVGLAKSVVGMPTTVGDSLINVKYGFVVTNFGDDTLRRVQVTDDLAYFFAPNTVVKTAISSTDPTFTLVANPAFTGRDTNTQLFDSTGTLAPGRSMTFMLDVTVQRATGDTTKVFNNLASVSAMNSVTTVTDLSTSGGDADPDNDGNPANNTGLTSFTLGVQPPAGPNLGLALAVVRIEPQPDSSYNVTYKATLMNYGDVDLHGISLTDSLIRAFAAPVSYSVVGSPMVGAGSTLIVNADFDGNAQADILKPGSYLAAGVQDTVLVMVNVMPNLSNMGPFFSSILTEGRTADSSQVVRDRSNNGLDPLMVGAVSTAVRFDLPKAMLGVAKSVGVPTRVSDGVYDVPYTIRVSNMGSEPLTNVQVVDNLAETFGHGALIVSNHIAVKAGAGLTVDSLYSGQGQVVNMLVDSLSKLAAGESSTLDFTVRVDVKNADSLVFHNSALATARTVAGDIVEDKSAAGSSADPDNDLDPRNNSVPTSVTLNSLATDSYIGVAMAVRDTARQADGSYNVTYQIVVQNFGPIPLTGVSLSDTLANVFNSQTGATYSILNAPITISTGSTLKLNPSFNGGSEPMIVLGDSSSTLAVAQTDTILVSVNVAMDGSTTTFYNSAYAEALAGTVRVQDASTNGLSPDMNGNHNPTDSNEGEATPLILQPSNVALFIPQGFSPNGDGINDLFVIRGTGGLTISLEVYNRWGNLVYKNDDYKNDWDGKPNAGISLGADANGVPDGTYYYVVRTSDGRRFVRYMTINR